MFAGMLHDPVDTLLECYPKIFLACHTRHVRDPKTSEVLSASQASILDHLDTVEAIGLLDLARHMGVTPATMSIAVDRLVRRGYVERARDTGDARRVRIRLTAAGNRIKEAQSVLDPALVRSMLATLSEEELADGLHGLSILARAAGHAMRARSEQGTWASRPSAAREGREGARAPAKKAAGRRGKR